MYFLNEHWLLILWAIIIEKQFFAKIWNKTKKMLSLALVSFIIFDFGSAIVRSMKSK